MTEDNYIPHSRATIEQQIEDLISLLDFLDGDPDREANGDDEPSLGWAEMEGRYGVYLVTRSDDLEEQCEDEGADHDGREPEDFV
jgi:hypothetical protein